MKILKNIQDKIEKRKIRKLPLKRQVSKALKKVLGNSYPPVSLNSEQFGRITEIMKGKEDISLLSKEDCDALNENGVLYNSMKEAGVDLASLYKNCSARKNVVLLAEGGLDIQDFSVQDKHNILKVAFNTEIGTRYVLTNKDLTKYAIEKGFMRADGEYHEDNWNRGTTSNIPYLMYADYKVGSLLLKYGANPDGKECIDYEFEKYSWQSQILESALTENNKDKVAVLLKYGANPFLVERNLDIDNPAHRLIINARQKGEEYYFSGQARYDAVQKYVVSPIKEKILSELKAQIKAYQKSQDLIQHKADMLRDKLGDKVGKTADVKMGQVTDEHREIAKTQVEISKAIMKAKRESEGKGS